MRVAVYGAGAVGGYFGGRLAQAGEDVVFIARGDHLHAIRERGLRVDSLKGDFVIHPAQATDDPVQAGPVDAILVTVKAWQVPDAALAMRPMIGNSTFVVPFQNGVDAPGQLSAVLGKDKVLGGLSKIFCYIIEPGHLRHGGAEPAVSFGELDNRKSERAIRLQQAFENAGVRADIPADIHAAMWEKFLFIATLSGIGAVCRAPIGILRSIPQTRAMLEQSMNEILSIARAKGIAIREDVVARAMGFVDSLPAEGTASMQRDVLDGKPSELEHQNGTIVRLGKELGVETPLHSFLYHALLPLEMRARGQIPFP